MKGLMYFSNRLVRPQNPNGPGWKIKPTIDAEPFDVNPQPDEPGLFLDQLTVVFKPGTTPAEIQAINAEIGATVLIYPRRSSAYRVKIPSTIMLDQAFHYYASQPQVQGVLPGMNYAQYALVPSEGLQSAHHIARLPNAWEMVQSQIGTVGSSRVRVAVIEANPFDLAHPDLYLNIYINQGELPDDPFDRNGNGEVDQDDIDDIDCDGDGLLTFWDFALCPDDPNIIDVTPPDINIRVGDLCDYQYMSANGTSFSAPTVAGVSALILSVHPEWIGVSYAANNVRNRLLTTASLSVEVRELGVWLPLEINQPLLNAEAAVAH
jgi:subtilisin family serine protease